MTENCVAGSVQFYTVSEAATLLEWSEDRVWMALETGQLPAIAPAFWGNPEEPIKYRFATPAVVLAIRAANTDEVAWMDDGPVGPARFPADPSKIRLLAEYVDALQVRGDPAISPPSKKRPGRLKSEAPILLAKILDALDEFAASNNEPFDRQAMPGPLGVDWEEKGSFHWLCASIDPIFRKSKATFERYRNGGTGIGKCALAPWAGARPSDFYSRALPVIAPKLGGS